VGRLRYLGLFLYDADAVTAAAAVTDPKELYDAQMDVLLDPNDPAVQAEARAQGIPEDWIDAARRSPVYALAKVYKVALPLHPEYRTLPMVWYVPPLSPVLDTLTASGYDAQDPDEVLPAVGDLRVPLRYVANVLAAGDPAPVEESLRRLLAMRIVKRRQQLGDADPAAGNDSGMSPRDVDRLYALLALARYDERYVVPKARREQAGAQQTQHGDGAVDTRGRER
jgi:nitrate reductase beta subunit